MATEKVSLTLEESLISEAKQIAGRRGFSRYVSRALRNQLQHDRIAGLLHALEEEHGPLDASVRDDVRKSWPASEARRSA